MSPLVTATLAAALRMIAEPDMARREALAPEERADPLGQARWVRVLRAWAVALAVVIVVGIVLYGITTGA